MAGQEKHCSICHRRETEKKHMEVSKNICYLCHFKKTSFDGKRSKCQTCHVLPTEVLGTGDFNITHKTLEKKNTLCISCHLQNIKGSGNVNLEKCLACHVNDEIIFKSADDPKEMHKEHVAAQAASCFSCHDKIEHGNINNFDTKIRRHLHH